MSKPLSEFTSAALLDEKGGMSDPPMMVVLRRKAIRQLPGNRQRVALYVNDALGLEVTFPYELGQIGGKKATASLKENTHDVLYGEYLHYLQIEDYKSAEHIAGKVERDYGTDSLNHFRVAAKLHCEGDTEGASDEYKLFEETLEQHTTLMSENVLHKLRHIARSQQFGDVTFKAGKDGKAGPASRVDPKDATKILKFWAVATPGNRKAIEKHINSGHSGIQKIVKFVDDHYKIPGKKKKGK